MDMLPGLARTQQTAINARAYARFTDMPVGIREIPEFNHLVIGNLYILTFRFTRGYVPPPPLLRRDINTMLGGGYAQDQVLVSVVKVVRKLGLDEVEVELEVPVCMSHRNGPTETSDRFSLHRDGHVKYFPDASNATTDWSSFRPRWEHTLFPVLPVVVGGCDFPPVGGDGSAPRPDGGKRSRRV